MLACGQLLDMEGRVDWKNCKVPHDEEAQMAKDFKKQFKEFDFNFEDDW